MPPSILTNCRPGDALDSSKFTQAFRAINQLSAGAFGPQISYPSNFLDNAGIQQLILLGSNQDFLFCYPMYQAADKNILIAVLKPYVLTQSFNNVPIPLYVYPGDGTEPATNKYTVSYSNYSPDGNSRLATRSDGKTEVQVIDIAYEIGPNILATPFDSQLIMIDWPTISKGNYWLVTSGGTASSVIPDFLVGTTASLIDMNIAARHWTAQTIS